MLSQSRLKFLRSLHLSKFRNRENLFLVSGEKLVQECMAGAFSEHFQLKEILALKSWTDQQPQLQARTDLQITDISPADLERLSVHKNPSPVIALMAVDPDIEGVEIQTDALYLGLDRIQDPGNLGTLFRLAEWFGISGILISPDSAHPLQPKVLQSGMGSVLRVPYEMTDLSQALSRLPEGFQVIGTLLDGQAVSQTRLPEAGLILIGNESKGLSAELAERVDLPLTIPRFQAHSAYPESLNVAVATAIILQEFRR